MYRKAKRGREYSLGREKKRVEEGRALMGIESLHRERESGREMDGLHVVVMTGSRISISSGRLGL